MKELQKWTQINPVAGIATEKLEKDQTGKRNQQFKPPLPIFNTHQSKPHSGNQCVYCEDDNHRAINCTKVTSVYERQKILSEKKLCFNCTSTRHHADECKSKLRCQICDRKHHTSICHKQENQANPLLVATGIPTGNVTYPVVVVEVEGIKCRTLSDTGAGSSYASAALLDRISSIEHKKEVRKIEMLLGASTREVELATIAISDVNRKFSMPVEVTKVDKGELLILENPKYREVIERNPHLSGVVMNDVDTKSRLPVHIILGAGDFAKLKTESVPKIGEPGQPVAELTKFGWIIMSPGKEPLDLTNLLLTQTSHGLQGTLSSRCTWLV